MNSIQTNNKDQYYTEDHEWIEFQGAVAYIGICRFKLTGFKQIQHINFNDAAGFKKQGEVIATVSCNEYTIEAHMPVDGKILSVNDKLLTGNLDILLDCSESSAWLALIVPSEPHERKALRLPRQYQMNGKNKYAK